MDTISGVTGLVGLFDHVVIRHRATEFAEKYQVVKAAVRFMLREKKLQCIAANSVMSGLEELNGFGRYVQDPRNSKHWNFQSRPLHAIYQYQSEKGNWVTATKMVCRSQLAAKTRTIIAIHERYYEEKEASR